MCIRIPSHPLQPCKVDHSHVGLVFNLNMFLKHLSLFSLYSDPMGEEHHIRRTSRVPPLMVVVSVFCLFFFHSIIDIIEWNDNLSYLHLLLISSLFISLTVPKRLLSANYNTALELVYSIAMKKTELYLLPWCWITLILKLFSSVRLGCFSFLIILQWLTADLCVVVFSGTCTVLLQREETHVNTPARPRPSMTMWVSTDVAFLFLSPARRHSAILHEMDSKLLWNKTKYIIYRWNNPIHF